MNEKTIFEQFIAHSITDNITEEDICLAERIGFTLPRCMRDYLLSLPLTTCDRMLHSNTIEAMVDDYLMPRYAGACGDDAPEPYLTAYLQRVRDAWLHYLYSQTPTSSDANLWADDIQFRASDLINGVYEVLHGHLQGVCNDDHYAYVSDRARRCNNPPCVMYDALLRCGADETKATIIACCMLLRYMDHVDGYDELIARFEALS